MNMRLKEFRENMGLTQDEISRQLGMSKSYYSKIESGYQKPSFKFLEDLKKQFPIVSVDEMFFGK